MWYPLRAFSQVLLLDAKSSNRVTFELSTLQVFDTTFAKDTKTMKTICILISTALVATSTAFARGRCLGGKRRILALTLLAIAGVFLPFAHANEAEDIDQRLAELSHGRGLPARSNQAWKAVLDVRWIRRSPTLDGWCFSTISWVCTMITHARAVIPPRGGLAILNPSRSAPTTMRWLVRIARAPGTNAGRR